jgi:hypothetical protein
MTDKEFSPPDYTETRWRILDESTGEVVATETVWTDDGAEPSDGGVSAALLGELAMTADGRHRELKVRGIERVTEQLPVRVDTDENTLLPLRIERP